MTANDVIETSIWCDEAGVTNSDLRTHGKGEPCMYDTPMLGDEERCRKKGEHTHWDHFGYPCLSEHVPVAIVRLEKS